MDNAHPEAVVIYNLFPRLAGPFSEWGAHFDRARRMNFNWIFVNPIQYPGFSGSMYAIKDYYRIDPRYADSGSKDDLERQLKAVLEDAHNKGLKVMLDLVINHTSIDSELTKVHRDWYKLNDDGSIYNPRAMDGDRILEIWGDLAEIDNENSADRVNLWKYWQDFTGYLIDLGVDGFRCDAAYMVPAALWQQLINYARQKNPNVRFFAETLGCPFEDVIKLAGAGFDYTFNSSKYWDFNQPWALEQYEQNRSQGAPSVSFAESHDTPRLAEELQGNAAAIKMRYLFSALFSTGVMMPLGFEYGFKKRLNVAHTTPADWEDVHFDLQEFIAGANKIKYDYPVFARENRLEVIPAGNPNILCFRKTDPDGKAIGLVILNKDVHNHQYVEFRNIRDVLQQPKTMRDISVEYARDIVPGFFEYHLRPAQVIVLIGEK